MRKSRAGNGILMINLFVLVMFCIGFSFISFSIAVFCIGGGDGMAFFSSRCWRTRSLYNSLFFDSIVAWRFVSLILPFVFCMFVLYIMPKYSLCCFGRSFGQVNTSQYHTPISAFLYSKQHQIRIFLYIIYVSYTTVYLFTGL